MLKSLSLAVLTFLVGTFDVFAVEKSFTPTPEQAALIKMITNYNAALEVHQKASLVEQKKYDLEKFKEFEILHDPSYAFTQELLKFEEKHRGSDVGLLALREIGIILSHALWNREDVNAKVRRQSLERFAAYKMTDEFPELLSDLDVGPVNLEVDAYLEQIAKDQAVSPTTREMAILNLADRKLQLGRSRALSEKFVRELTGKNDDESRVGLAFRMDLLKRGPSQEQVLKWEAEAIESLAKLAKSDSGLRRPIVTYLDPDNAIFKFDKEKTALEPKISEVAAGIHLRETSLRIGKQAPELNVKLTDGNQWSMNSQRGKVTIVQFTFQGCGGCVRMYKELHQIQKAHGEKVSILSITSDDTEEEAIEAKSSGKVGWNVHWDQGAHGPVRTQWGIIGFPTVYVVDRQGKVSLMNLGYHEGELSAKVAELMER